MKQLKTENNGSKGGPLPQVEIQFSTWKRAQRAATLLNIPKFTSFNVFISEILFEDYGRRLILKLDSSEALPSELVAFVFNVVDVASAECPLTKDINIPLVQN